MTQELPGLSRVLASMRTLLPALLLAACTPREPTPEAAPAGAPVKIRAEAGELVLRRTLCYGDCPSYTAIVDATGDVFFHGREFSERQGLQTGTVDPALVQQLFGLALDNEYFDADHAYERQITDNPTVYTSVVADGRRHWVRNYARTAPESVQTIEEGIDALLFRTTWDAMPRVEPVIGNEACLELGRAIENRCKDILTLRGRGADCNYWFSVWEELGERGRDEPHRPERCARQLRSLALASAPPIAPLPERELGPKCRHWFAELPDRCHRDLLAGNVGSCNDLEETMEIVVADLHDPSMDPAMQKRIAEMHCDMFFPDDISE